MKAKHRKSVPTQLIVALACLFAAAILFVYRQPMLLQRAYEDVSYHLNPTPERALVYGLRHFNAQDQREYDVSRAKYFFEAAAKLDSKYPMVNYELGRIAFLQGKFQLALAYINAELDLNATAHPENYYVRALTYGYMGDYAEAEKDYDMYFNLTPANWASINDYSWVLLKDGLPIQAHDALTWGLKQWPENAWLLSNDATALYEMKRFQEAAVQAKKALPAVQALTVEDWLTAYPGNDPLIAQTGLENFKKSAQENLQKILAKAK